jgi:beta-lactamase class A
VKVPIAIAVLRAVDRGQLTLDTPVTLRASDYVDGAGSTNRQAPGSRIPVRKLLEQMIVYSDNTASDLLIGTVGIDAVNRTLRTLVPAGFGRITLLGDVRREIYGELTPAARRLAGRDWLQLQALPNDTARLQLLSRQTGVAPTDFRQPGLDAAYDRYYAGSDNTGRLDAYGELLAALVQGRALEPASTDHLLGLMQRIATGRHRVGAGLPPTVEFAHKTGTQRRRICDSGILTVPHDDAAAPQRVLLVACAREDTSLARSERALMQVGEAVCRSGLITKGVPDAPTCHATVGPSRRPAASQRGSR